MLMSEIDKVISIAMNEVGYIEKKSNANLYDKTSNAGSKNYTKYARDLDSISGFYNGKKQGFAWCAVFVDWCMVQALGADRARQLLCYPKNSCGAGCSESIRYYKNAKRFVTSSPRKGDQIFFKQGHTGLVYYVDSSKVYTIEGNTTKSLWVVANGGEVCKKSYNLKSSSIIGYGRPDYKIDDNTSNDKITEKFGYRFGTCNAYYRAKKVKAIRREPDLSENVKKVKEISKDLRPGLTSKNLNAKAHIKVGCTLTILEIIEDSNGLIWGRNYDGWLVLCEKNGDKQLVFVRNK